MFAIMLLCCVLVCKYSDQNWTPIEMSIILHMMTNSWIYHLRMLADCDCMYAYVCQK